MGRGEVKKAGKFMGGWNQETGFPCEWKACELFKTEVFNLVWKTLDN